MADGAGDAKEALLGAVDAVVVADGSVNDAEVAKTGQRATEAQRNRMLLISFVLMIFVGLGNRIMNILQFTPMYNYPLFVNLLTTGAYLPTCLLYIIPMIKYRPDVITPESRAVPQRVWLIMGTLDSIAGVMQSFATAYLSADGALVVLLMQSAIPSSMLITRLFLKTKYKQYQYVGASLVIVGILIVLVPQLVKGVTGVSNLGVWAAVLVLSCVPMCLSSVYKEKALGDTEIDPIYMNFWVAVYQFLVAFPLLVPMGYASQPAIDAKDLGTNLRNGALCYAGINSVTTNSTGQQIDDCHMGPVFVNVYIMFNLAYNVLIILMLKYGSSNILWLCFTLQVPIANLAFALPFMPNSQKVGPEDGVGLVVIMGGLVIYRFYNQLKALVLKYMRRPVVPPGFAATSESLPMLVPGAEGEVSDATLLGESPTSQLGGSTPVRGMHTHVTRSTGGAAKKAEALAAARAKLRDSK